MSQVHIWTDGSTTPSNPGPGGYSAVLVFENGGIKSYGRYVTQDTTNNAMETMAILLGIRAAKAEETVPDLIVFHTDSQYVVYGMQRIEKSRVLLSSNRDIWEIVKAEAEGLNIQTMKTEGHNGDQFNESAHDIAYYCASTQSTIKQESLF